ncbi:hypothetical protein N9B57_02660 [Verrucomicrobia bacterium]|nr:hypothetical protein [Verrucomicrobiota bacterium]
MTVTRSEIFDSLPALGRTDYLPEIQTALRTKREKLVVLDDDPTGTQTVYDIPVLTEWSVSSLREEFQNELDCFYLLTNSRSLGEEDARQLNLEIAANLKTAAEGKPFRVVSRSDSTLRGHYPLETDALTEVLGPFDGVLLVPYFEAGGRYTIGDVHYVAEGDTLLPAAETPFARDVTFGYRKSNLREWVEEKTKGRIEAQVVESISIDQIRNQGVDGVETLLLRLQDGVVCIVNAAAPSDLETMVLALARAEEAGKRFLFRTGAQFVSTRIGLRERNFWRPEPSSRRVGGLVVVGSHVPKSTQQLNHLLEHGQMETIEFEVKRLIDDEPDLVSNLVSQVDQHLIDGRDVVVYTSRDLVLGANAESSLALSRRVSEALVTLVRSMTVSPSFFVAKGGITSSDLATKGLGVRRAMVLGPILPGVPVWETGDDTRFPEIPYIVFPGNVGGAESLLEVVQIFQRARA